MTPLLSFSPFTRQGDLVDLSACVGSGDKLESQIASAFDKLISNLEAAGGQASDLVAVHTSHVQLTVTVTKLVLEEFTKRALRPTWTPVGVLPFYDSSCLVQIRGQAVIDGKQEEIEVDHTPPEFAACIKVGDHIFVSGQTGEDVDGILPEEQLEQVTNSFERVDRAIRKAGGDGFNDATHFTSWSVGEYSVMIPQIRQIARTSARLNEKQTCWTFLGADSLPRGLVMIHADHIVRKSQNGVRHSPGAVGERNSTLYKYEQAISYGDNVWLSGQGAWEIDDPEAPFPKDQASQIAQAFVNIERVVAEAGGRLSDVKAFNTYLVGAISPTARAMLDAKLAEFGGAGSVIGSVSQVTTLAFSEMLAEIQVYATK